MDFSAVLCYNSWISPHTPKAAGLWIRWERILLVTLLIGRFSLLLRRMGTVIGFDPGAHTHMLEILSWAHPDSDIHGSFYGYHPPLGFLIPHTIQILFGLSAENSVVWTSFLAALATFFLLRETLRHCNLLRRPSGIAFLYIVSSIPIQISALTSINLDGIVLAMATAVLCASVHIFWPDTVFEDAHQPERPLPLHFGMQDPIVQSQMHNYAIAIIALCTALAGAALTKFSGVLLLAIPVFVSWAQPYGHGWWKRCTVGAAGCALAIAIVFPYYHTRYYMQEGRYFPLNTEWDAGGAVQDAIAQREQDPGKFFTDLFSPSPVHAAQGITHPDDQTNRLADMWRDFWVRRISTGETTHSALRMGLLYMLLAPWLMLVGFILFLRNITRRNAWVRLGWVLLAFSLLQLAAMIHYIYRIPFAGWVPAKGLYVLPSIWGITYLIVNAFLDHRLIPKPLRGSLPKLQHVLMAAVLMFVAINHGIPVY